MKKQKSTVISVYLGQTESIRSFIEALLQDYYEFVGEYTYKGRSYVGLLKGTRYVRVFQPLSV